MRVAIVANNLGRTSGRVQGQVAMQMPQEAFSAKNGMHLSKSTYHRSTPRTICLCSRIAPGGQEFVHTWHVEQNSSAPKTIRVGRDERHSVVTPARRTPALKCRLIREPCLPSSPNRRQSREE